MRKQLIFVITLIAFAGLLLAPHFAIAASTPANITQGVTDIGNNLDLGKEDLKNSVAGVINIALGLLGLIAVVLVVVGGFMWMTAAGNEEKIEKAKQLLFSALVGLVIIVAAWSIANFFVSQVVTVTT